MSRKLFSLAALAVVLTPFATAQKPTSARPRPSRQVFAHYMGCCPVATGPQAWHKKQEPKVLRHGRKDKATRRGGHVRNWDLVPFGTTLTPEESADLEIRRAVRIGIDGFAVDAWAGHKDARRSLDALFAAAEAKDYPFQITICPDPACGGDLVGAVKYLLEKHGDSPKLARRNSRPLIFGYSSTGLALWHVERQRPRASKADIERLRVSPEGWELMGQAFREAERKVGQPVFYHYCLSHFFHRVPKQLYGTDTLTRAAGMLGKHLSALGGFGYLGPSTADIAAAVKASGAEWSCPIGFYQKENIPYEVHAGKGVDRMVAGWERVRDTEATLLQFTTWNDYGENSNIAPAYNTRYTLYDLTGYFIAWWKTGAPPKPERDKLYIISRKYPPAVKVFPFEQGPYKEGAIEVVTILATPATVRLPGRDAEFEAPAGFFRKQFPVTPGPVVAELLRDGKVVLNLANPEPVTERPFREDNSMVCMSTEFRHHWQADFGKAPPLLWSEYGDTDN
ncbi:MAG: hypothetical protein HON70_36980, partial [Lentisphaerae bacterium]|nr:hypothetical protein [Lentisphaerota bacterium]